MSSKKGRIKWNDSWLEKIDKQGQKCGTWAVKEDLDFAWCNLCACRFKYSGSGGSKLIEHSSFDKHQENYNLSQSNLILASNSSPSPSPSMPSNQQAIPIASPSLTLDFPKTAKARSAEAKFLFKVAESFYFVC